MAKLNSLSAFIKKRGLILISILLLLSGVQCSKSTGDQPVDRGNNQGVISPNDSKQEEENESSAETSAEPTENSSEEWAVPHYSLLIKNNVPLIKTIVVDTTYELTKGVWETDLKFINYSEEPLSINFLTVDLAYPDISLEIGLKNDESIVTGRHETVKNMILAKNKNFENRYVVAGVNGDYWQINDGQEIPVSFPLGMVFKDGEELKGYPRANEYYYLATLEEGGETVLSIGKKSDYEEVKDRIINGLGGRYLLVYHKGDQSGLLNKNIEPRTTVGIFDKTKLVFFVVDGRRSGHSVGLTMQDLARIHIAIGVTDAINLDGGGSSTFVTKEENTPDYIVKNKPSGNSERAVANSWMVVKSK